MCGLFGILEPDASTAPSEARLRASLERLGHRGPDAARVWSAPGVGLAHTRLSLVDPGPRSHQPFWDETRRYVLVYNGEIYNFRELRAELEQRGVAFLTSSDTEVLLQCLIHDAPERVLPRLGGMFAFGFYDTQERTLLLARDRFGMKPLYLYEGADCVAFASEIKALRPWIPGEVDRFSVASYLLGFGGPSKGFTFHGQVRALAPGGFVVLRHAKPPEHGSFFALPDFLDPEQLETLARLSPGRVVDRMEELLWKSVERHMFADCPVGAFCSGGVDSSLLMAMAAKQHHDLAIFHADVLGPASEVGAARELSRHLGLDLEVVAVGESDFVDQLPDVMQHYEHPFTYHPNSVPFLMVSRLVRARGVKGVLSGEGSDELFLGYPWLARERGVAAYHALGARLRRLVHRLPGVGRILWPPPDTRGQALAALFNRRETADDERAARRAAAALAPSRVSHGQLRTLDHLDYHLRTLLHRNDTLGMAASIEARFPFLDHDVVRTAVNMPTRYKLRFAPDVLEKAHPFVRDKWVIRRVADRWLPRRLSRRAKQGFWTPVSERLRVAPEYFESSFVRELFELSPGQVADTLAAADPDLAMRLLHLELWGQVCLAEQPLEHARAKLQRHVRIAPA